jgi:hypothetical protein
MNFVTRSVDRADLVLPSGVCADSLRLVPLRRELERLRVPDLPNDAGKETLLDAYAAHIASIAEQIYERAARPGELRCRDISQAAARRAAALIERRAAQAGPPATPSTRA